LIQRPLAQTEPKRHDTCKNWGPVAVLVERFSRFSLFLCGEVRRGVGVGEEGWWGRVVFHYLPKFKLGARTAAHGVTDLKNNYILSYLNISLFFLGYLNW